MPDFGKDSVDAFGLSEFLPNEESDDDKKEEKAFADFRPLSFEIQSVKTGRHRRQADISMKKNGGSKHKKRDQDKKGKDKDPDKKKKHRDNKRGVGTDKASEVFISKVKTPFDRISGEYQVSFVSDETVENLMLGIKIGSDDDNLSRAEIESATLNGNVLVIKSGMIEIGAVSKGEKKILRIKLLEAGRKTLEVRAYAKR